ncbi:sugar transferase [Cohnella ginsengisoli]|uniref:Sugar transferase n=1 Tax=Cohnella ginsengisoli TaxID=425004 RepID=A0A9X4KLL7_9BACL|nr:sugar transferase [Cohnella ginsengisoli]MDG0794519.1 sugar transferase [Cohnella ginsengisoli]
MPLAGGPAFKLKADPRVTRSGRWLRKYSLDELPQLWNVLRGDMSLIGPRPPLPDEVAQYTNYHWRRMDVLPGMTGLWQVSGRSDLDFEAWIDLDIQYIERWSFALEMKILLKTIPVVIKGTGAY